MIVRPQLLFLAIGVVASLPFGCRPAVYEILKPGSKSQGPEAPPQNVATGQPPVAGIEVVVGGTPVSTVTVNQPTTIQPTKDTLDPDYKDKGPCQTNAGIVKADYSVGDAAKPSVQRTADGCEPLGVPYTFPKEGTYTITLTVLSQDQQTASATTTITVTKAPPPPQATVVKPGTPKTPTPAQNGPAQGPGQNAPAQTGTATPATGTATGTGTGSGHGCFILLHFLCHN